MTQALQLQLDGLIRSETFQKSAAELKTVDDFFTLLHNNGVNLSDDDIEYCMDQAESAMIKDGLMTEDGELSEELLTMVAGGGVFGGLCTMAFGGLWVAGGAAYISAAHAGIAGFSACMAIGGACCAIGGVLIVAGAIGVGYAIYKKRKKK